MTSRAEKLQKAAKWIRKAMSNRPDKHHHPSHYAARVLQEADKNFDLNSFGVEGWTDSVGRSGVQYLNFGDPYESTIVVRSSPHSHSVHVAMGGWASYA